jgi:hypothetical protein
MMVKGAIRLGVLVCLVAAGSTFLRRQSASAERSGRAEPVKEELLRTVIKGLEHRESQLTRLVGETVLDTYYGTAFWSLLKHDCEPVRNHKGDFGDRDRVVVRFELCQTGYKLEAQSLYWGGSNVFFMVDPERGAKDIAGLYLVRGVHPPNTFYSVSRERGLPMASYHAIGDSPSGFSRDQPARWLGLCGAGNQSLSSFIRERTQPTTTCDCRMARWGNLDCVIVSAFGVDTAPSVHPAWRVQWWFSLQHECALVREEWVFFPVQEPDGHAGQRRVTEWRDFQPVEPFRSQYPRRYLEYEFAYGGERIDSVRHIRDAEVRWLKSNPPKERELVDSVLPPGALLIPPMAKSPDELTPPDYLETMSVANQLWDGMAEWAKRPWEKAVPTYPPEWSVGITESERRDILERIANSGK